MSEITARKVTQLLQPDISEADRGARHLFGESQFTLQTFSDRKGHSELAKLLHGPIDQHVSQLIRLQNAGAGVFWMVNEGDGKGRKEHNVTRVRCLFVDTDGADLPPIVDALPPHAIIETSPGKYHVYWKVEGLKRTQFRAYQKALARRFGTDPSVCDLPRVMRVPGFYHLKDRDNPFKVSIVELNDLPPYTAFDIEFDCDLSFDDVDTQPQSSSVADCMHYLPPTPMKDTRESLALIKSALDTQSPDCDYPLWRNIGYSVKSTGVTGAEQAFREWSMKSDKYDEKAFDLLVRSYKDDRRGDMIGPGTLFGLAKKAGWKDPTQSEGADRKFTVRPAHEFASVVAALWLIRNMIPQDSIGVLFGEPGSGKSFFTLDMTLAVSRNSEWRGNATAGGGVVYIAAEGAGGVRKRLSAAARSGGISLEDIKFGVIDDTPNLLQDDDLALADAINDFGGVVLVVVDTLASVTPGGNENSAEDMGAVIARCKRLKTMTNAAVLLVHHSGKDSSKGMRGWSGLLGAVDYAIEITRKGDERVARITKQKDGEDGAEFPFVLRPVDLGTDPDGTPISSCVVEHVTSLSPQKLREPTGRNQKIVIKAARRRGPCSIDELLNDAVTHMTHDPSKRDRRREHAKRATDELIESGHLIHYDQQITLYDNSGDSFTTDDPFEEDEL